LTASITDQRVAGNWSPAIAVSWRSLRSGTPHDNEDLFVTESFDGIEPRRFPRGVCAENDPTSAHITSAVIIQENQGVGMSGQYRSNGQP